MIDKSFFNRSAVEVARDLIGKAIVVGDQVGIVAETEAYCGEEDLACHARFGRTGRSEMLYRAPGTLYVYLCYGMHWMLNIVCGEIDNPQAVLIRGIIFARGRAASRHAELVSASDEILKQVRDDIGGLNIITGPGRVTKYLKIDGSSNGKMVDCERLTRHLRGGWMDSSEVKEVSVSLADGIKIDKRDIISAHRIGINFAPEPWKSKNWRFYIKT